MHDWVSRLAGSVVRDESVTLQVRLFRLFCATACVLCLVVILPINLFQNLPVAVNVANSAIGLLAGLCFRQSLRGRNYFLGFLLILILALNPVWFLNAGSEGSIAYYFFPILLYPISTLTGRTRNVMTAVVALNLCALLLFEYFHPSLLVPFQNPTDRLLDLVSGAFCGCLAVAVVMRLIVGAYDREQRRLSLYAERLAASERTYREIFNATSDALVIHDLTGRLLDVNDRMCAIFGYDRATALRQTIASLSLGTSPYSEVEAADRLARALSSGPQVFTWRSRRASGELFWSEVGLRAGEIAGERRVIASIRDISLRVQAQEALREEEERLRLALEASNQGWFDLDLATGEGRASAEYARIIGREPVDFRVTAKGWLDGVHPEDREAVAEAFQACVAGGGSRSAEYRRKTKAGEWKWIRSIGKIVEVDRDGKALRMLGTHTDITTRKELEARLLHSQRLQAVATLAGGVAHDLNNLLTPMLAAGSILSDKVTDPEDQELLASLESGARRGAAIVRQLLVFSQSLAQERVRVDPAQLIADAAGRMRASGPASLTVVERVPVGLWAVSGDPQQLQQVMDNLCANARAAMPQGGTLTLSAENSHLTRRASTRNPWDKDGAFVTIAVSDTGRGIPPEIIDQIFDPFFTTKAVGEGPGLGLSTVYGIVNGLGGMVAVESEPGRGATFKVSLPARGAAPAAKS